MNRWADRLRLKLQQFLSGRNGMDHLGRDIYVVSLILLFAALFTGKGVVYLISLLGFGYSLFRCFSKKLFSRRIENQKYLAFKERQKSRLRLLGRRWKDRKTYKYYRCGSCRQMIRVPKGKGRIEIRCPKCGNTFIKKT